ncbi:MAG: diguanylate cyclase domain-containing protein [bacterium]
MNTRSEQLAGSINFQELLENLDINLVALDADWNIQYLNQAAKHLFGDTKPLNESFWNSLNPDFEECFETAYQKALLGVHNQLEDSETHSKKEVETTEIYSDVALEMIEQKPLSFQFHCEDNGCSYSINTELHRGHFILRIEDISDRVSAQIQAQKNEQELEEALIRMKQAKNANPLTELPGNVRIQETLKQKLNSGDQFALMYVDLDHFKPFNDRYGFERGDDVLLLLRDILQEELDKTEYSANFLGHVGGDDFVVMTGVEDYEQFCRNVIEEFDHQIPDHYDEEDRQKGKIIMEDRTGEKCEYSIMTVSIAVVTNKDRSFDSYLEMTEVAAEVKKLAKKDRDKSCFRVDRRTDNVAT